LTQVATGVTIKASDGVLSGPVSSSFSLMMIPVTITYTPIAFYENQALNNGSISGSMLVTLSA
jgi:hypothetical protein